MAVQPDHSPPTSHSPLPMLLIRNKSSVAKKPIGGARKGRTVCKSPCGNCGVKECQEGPRHRRAVYVAEGYLCNACYWYSNRHGGQPRPLHLILQHGAKAASPKSHSHRRRVIVADFDVAEAMLKLKLAPSSASQMVSPPNPILLNVNRPKAIIKIPRTIERPIWTPTVNYLDAYECIEMIPEDILERNLIVNKMSAEWQSATKDLSKDEIMAALSLLGYRKHNI